MCGRMTQQRPTSELAEIFDAEDRIDAPGGRFNLAPTDDAAVVVKREDHRASWRGHVIIRRNEIEDKRLLDGLHAFTQSCWQHARASSRTAVRLGPRNSAWLPCVRRSARSRSMDVGSKCVSSARSLPSPSWGDAAGSARVGAGRGAQGATRW